MENNRAFQHRVSDIPDEPQDLTPIVGWKNKPLLPLPEAVQHVPIYADNVME